MKPVQSIPVIKEVKPLGGFKLYMEFSDGVKATVDLSHLKGNGVFAWWDNDDNFSKVHISEHGDIVWNDEVEIDTLNCYLKIINKTFEEYAGS